MQGLGYSLRPMAKMGRPTKYHDRLTMLAARLLAEKGMTDVQIAEELEVTEATITGWKKKYPDFFSSLKEGKSSADDKVEAALYQRAIGFVNPKAVKIFMPQGAPEPIYAPYEEYYAPDVAAAFIWLKNRRPEKWRDKHEVALDTAVEIKVSFDPRGL